MALGRCHLQRGQASVGAVVSIGAGLQQGTHSIDVAELRRRAEGCQPERITQILVGFCLQEQVDDGCVAVGRSHRKKGQKAVEVLPGAIASHSLQKKTCHLHVAAGRG